MKHPSSGKKNPWILVLIFSISVVVLFSAAISFSRRPNIAALDRQISHLLRDYSITKSKICLVKEYHVGKPLDVERFRKALEKIVKRLGFKLLRYRIVYESGKNVCVFEIGRDNKVLYILKLGDIRLLRKAPIIWKKLPVKIAIVIDDWGYNTNNIGLLDSINIPLTLSVLPSLPYSSEIAKEQHLHKDREIILHMPMEPEDGSLRLEKNTLLVSMKENQLLRLLIKSLNTVPYTKGISNHMGSKATQDKNLMRAVIEESRRRGLYFLDSIATPRSVCEDIAKSHKVKFMKRHIFLDNKDDKEYISSQMDKLVRLAMQRGYAVGIGHDRRLTLRVIKEKASELSGNGVEFVLVSELAK